MNMSLEAESPLLSMTETCRRLRYSRWTIRKLIRNGELEAVKGAARNAQIWVYEHSVCAYLTRNKIQPEEEGAA